MYTDTVGPAAHSKLRSQPRSGGRSKWSWSIIVSLVSPDRLETPKEETDMPFKVPISRKCRGRSVPLPQVALLFLRISHNDEVYRMRYGFIGL